MLPKGSMAAASPSGASSRAGTHRGSPRWCTKHRHGRTAVPASPGRRHETASPRRPRTPGHWYQRRALPPFHGLVQSIPIGQIDQRAAAPKRRQGRDLLLFLPGPEQHSQRRLDQLGHSAPLASRFAFQLCHDRIINVKGRFHFHMAHHIRCMVICQAKKYCSRYRVGTRDEGDGVMRGAKNVMRDASRGIQGILNPESRITHLAFRNRKDTTMKTTNMKTKTILAAAL